MTQGPGFARSWSPEQRSVVGCLLLLIALAGPAWPIDVFVRSPQGSGPIFGTVEVELEVLSAAAVASVEVWLDGERVAQATAPPWTFAVDVGDENRAHVFRFVATDVDGARAERTLETEAVVLDHVLDLELQQLYVTVTRDDRRLLGLEQENFVVTDNDEPQTIVTFERGDVPLTAVVLLDTSFSMQGDQLRTAVAGVEAFVRQLRPLDRAQLVLFADDAIAETPFTGEAAVIASVVGTARAGGGTAINDQLYIALKRLEARQGRRVIVLLSDGIDVESVLRMQAVQALAARVQALLYWIRPRPAEGTVSYYSSWRTPDDHRRELAELEAAVKASGGRVLTIERIDDATAALDAILGELREQYVFGYYPSVNENDGRWHAVEVRLRGARGRIRTRDGYYDIQP